MASPRSGPTIAPRCGDTGRGASSPWRGGVLSGDPDGPAGHFGAAVELVLTVWWPTLGRTAGHRSERGERNVGSGLDPCRGRARLGSIIRRQRRGLHVDWAG